VDHVKQYQRERRGNYLLVVERLSTEFYGALKNAKDEDVLASALTDLMHHCDVVARKRRWTKRTGQDMFDSALAQARSDYETEKEDQGRKTNKTTRLV
jgi:hypothetical protein